VTPIDGAPITGAMAGEMRARQGLAHVTPYRRLDVKLGEAQLEANDLVLSGLPRLGGMDTAAGSLAGLGPGRAVLSADGAEASGREAGDEITVSNGARSVRLTVAAVLPGEAPLHSSLLVDPVDLTRLGAPAAYSGVLADAAASGEKARTDGRTALTDVTAAAGAKWNVQVLADERDSFNDDLTLVLAIAIGLIGLTVLIAVVGVGTTTALSVVERVRESGLLRAVGLSRGGLRVMLTTESALYGVIGAALGLALGVPYAWLAVDALGVNAPLTLPAGQLALVFVALVLLTAAAGVLPARRAAKVSPVAALGTD
jgi:putative ABC transport system permease protein